MMGSLTTGSLSSGSMTAAGFSIHCDPIPATTPSSTSPAATVHSTHTQAAVGSVSCDERTETNPKADCPCDERTDANPKADCPLGLGLDCSFDAESHMQVTNPNPIM